MPNPDNKIDPSAITTVIVSGHRIPAALVVCIECKVLHLHTALTELGNRHWMATCPNGHTWEFQTADDAEHGG